jgi:Holliday junction resolvase RusA-like endonuclease
VKPDIDNLKKTVLDALEGVVWARDQLIVSCLVTKRYGEPGITLCVRW